MRAFWVFCLLAAAALVWWTVRPGGALPPERPRPGLPAEAAFVGSESCRRCHEERHETWLATAHAYSLRPVAPDVVAGRFDGTPFDTPHFTATPHIQDGDFRMRVRRKDGRPGGNFRVTHVVGRTFEQAYLYTANDGSWRVLPICWSLERGEWDPTHEVLDQITGHVGAVPANYDTTEHVFNRGCGLCHATDYDVGYDEVERLYRSTFLEGAVACESCHGPGSIHTAWHEQERDGDDTAARLLHPRRDLDARGILDSCGRCHYLHEWRYAIDPDPRVGHEQIATSLNRDRPGFFADGSLSGLSYHGTTQSQSACFQKGGMSCLSCHRMHGGERWAMKWEGTSDRQCTQCHDDAEAFGSAHTHHEDVRCVDCHMPRMLQGVLHFLRDHSLRSPRPELTERFGADQVPNACANCHGDRDAAWAREASDGWWGPMPRERVAEVEMVVRLRRDPERVASDELAAFVAAPERALWLRMTALHVLAGRVDGEARAAVRGALAAKEVDLLQEACAALALQPDRAAVPALLPLMAHPARTVRVEAAFAAARAGARGGESWRPVHADARRMLERMKPTESARLRIAFLADAADLPNDFRRELVTLRATGTRSPLFLELLHRHARRLTDSGDHAAALEQYAVVRDGGSDRFPELLWLDSADSLFASGNHEGAAGNWQRVVQAWPEGSILRTVSSARLAALAGRSAEAVASLEALATRLAADPSAAEELRRVRWSLDAVR